MATLGQDLRKLGSLKTKEKKAKAAHDKAKAERERHESHCFHRMKSENTSSQTVAGVRYSKAETTYASVQDREAFVNWAQENDQSLIGYKEQKGLINELVREKIDNGEELPPGLGFYVDEYVSKTAA